MSGDFLSSGEDISSSEEENGEIANSLRLRWSALSLSGTKKKLNDDYYLLFSASGFGMQNLLPEGESRLLNDDFFFGVSDGMGGGNAGNVASTLLLEELSRVIPSTFHTAASGFRPDYCEYLDETVKYVHQGLNMCAEVRREWAGMSATLTLAWFTPENMYMVNVGDSRLYLCREGKTAQISCDHTFAWKQWKRGEINEYQYRSHPRRSALYEVVGGGHQWLTPFVTSVPILRGDRIMLCSDGLVDGLWERRIAEYLADRTESPGTLTQLLGRHAMEADSRDDKTVIVIDVQ